MSKSKLVVPDLSKSERILDEFSEWMESQRFSSRTSVSYVQGARHFAMWLAKAGLRFVDAHHDDVQRYQGHLFSVKKLNGQALAPGTIVFRLEIVRCLYRFLLKRRYVAFDPCTLMDLPRVPVTLPRVTMTMREAKRIIERQEPGSLERAILEVLYATGVRVSELVSLKPEDVDVEGGLVHVIKGKGAKDRNVPLTQAASEAVALYLQKRGKTAAHSARLFCDERGALKPRHVSRIVKRCAQAARIPKRITPHVFRHTVATHLLRNGADIRQIQVFLGHASIMSTERYTRVELSDLRRVVEKAHPRGARA